LPAGTTVETGLKVLDIEYSIPQKFKSSTEQEVTRSFAQFTIPKSEYNRRMDFRERLTFTVDPEGSQDLDDALSIESLPNGQFRIGIHVADVSFFVKKGSPLDEEARSRATTFYPSGCRPVPMLPDRLSTDLCSLKPKQDRLTLSLFVTISNSAQLVDTQVRRCVINSNYRLTYTEVEDILDGDDIDQPITDELTISLHRLHKIAHRWRQQRLGNQGLYMNLDAEDALTPKAHLLVEELMIKTNHQVALLLLQSFPECTPLRTQLPPNEISLDEWRQKNAEIAKNTVALTQPFMHQGRVCLCTDGCKCIKSTSDEAGRQISIKYDMWQELMEAVAEMDELKLEDLVAIATNPENSPEMLVALLQLRGLQERSSYVCSANVPEDHQLHYNLKMMAYTHFTSPIRRYIDLVVHRLLVALLAKQASPYTDRDMGSICVQCTDASQKARRYEKETRTLQLSALLQNNPATLHAIVETVDESQIQLRQVCPMI
jgi:exoribonuclease R